MVVDRPVEPGPVGRGPSPVVNVPTVPGVSAMQAVPTLRGAGAPSRWWRILDADGNRVGAERFLADAQAKLPEGGSLREIVGTATDPEGDPIRDRVR